MGPDRGGGDPPERKRRPEGEQGAPDSRQQQRPELRLIHGGRQGARQSLPFDRSVAAQSDLVGWFDAILVHLMVAEGLARPDSPVWIEIRIASSLARLALDEIQP